LELNATTTPKVFLNGGKYTVAQNNGSGSALSGTWIVRGALEQAACDFRHVGCMVQRIA
jgi:hypothetical protein